MQNSEILEAMSIGKHLNCLGDVEGFIARNATLDEFRAHALKKTATPNAVAFVGSGDSVDIGKAFCASPEYIQNSKSRGSQLRAVANIGFSRDIRNATGTTTGLTSIEKLPSIITLGQQPTTVAELLTEVATDSATVRYIQEASFTNAAAAVAEGGQKPEASWALSEVDASVRKIAVVGRVTDEMFADYAQMRDYVNNRLRYMVQAKEDNDLLNGSGTSPAIKGLLNFGIQTQAVTGHTVPDAIHKAITKIRAGAYVEPDAIILHPNDWEVIRLMKDANGNYFGGNVFGIMSQSAAFVNTPQALWSKPVVTSTAIAQGTALVGAFQKGAAIFRKMGLTVESTNSDGDDFKYNRISIRAETRLALACYRPLAFCSVTGIA